MEMTMGLVAVVSLLAANAFFVAAEFALVKARGLHTESLARQDGAPARLTLRIQRNLEAYLGACQLGITMASLGLGWVGEATVTAILEPAVGWAELSPQTMQIVAFLAGFLILSSLHIVVGEQVPKMLAIRRPEPISLAIAYPLHWVFLAVYPLNWLLNRTSRAILRGIGVDAAAQAEGLSGEEITGQVATSHAHGEFERDNACMPRILFEFDHRQVGQVMIPVSRMRVLDVAATPAENLHVLRASGYSRFPLIDSRDNGAIVGIVLVKDLHAAMLDGDRAPWADLVRYVREPLVVPETLPFTELFDMMHDVRVHMAFTIDGYGQLAGIVTLEDLLKEIVSEVRDETESTHSELTIQRTGDAEWEVDGLIPLVDLERVTGYPVPDDLETNSLSRLFLRRHLRMPAVGDRIDDSGYVMTVLSLHQRGVGRVGIKKCRLEPAGPEGDTAAGRE